MKRSLLLLAAVGGLSVIALISTGRSTNLVRSGSLDARFEITSEAKNPWTGLTPNADPAQFQFIVVSDRTGGHRKGVFSRAVQQVNLLQPEFVMSVGDLIEGSAQADANRTQWNEFDKYAKQFKMPFFYCPGNHDANNAVKSDVWGERLGRRYYHFTYKDCLFMVLNTNDLEPAIPNAQRGPAVKVGLKQQEYIAKTLADNPNVNWTFIFLHHPIWAGRDLTETGWLEVEKSLTGRKYTVFCGHVHNYRKFLRNGMNYYQLATTGGGSAMRGIEYGEFDQVAWVTLKPDGPVIANILLDGVLKDDLRPFPSDEAGGEPGRTADPIATGKVTLNGKPAVGLQLTFTEIVPGGAGTTPVTGNARIMEDGSFTVYGNRRPTGVKPGRYAVTFAPAQSIVIDPKRPAAENPVPEKYRALNTTPFRVDVTADGKNQFEFKLES